MVFLDTTLQITCLKQKHRASLLAHLQLHPMVLLQHPSSPISSVAYFRACPTRHLPPGWLPVSQQDTLIPPSSHPHLCFSWCGT